MRASPRATPMTIPATVPLASRLLGDGVGLTVVVDLVGLLVGLVLGLVLLGVERLGVEISFGVDPGLELGAAPTPATGVVDVGKLVGPLLTAEETELEAEVVLGVPLPEAVGVTYPPS